MLLRISRCSLLLFGIFLVCGCGSQQVESSADNSYLQSCAVIIEGSELPAEPIRIQEGGLYCLAGNRKCSGTGIIVESDNVTIDLMGNQLIGPGKDSGENYGILTNKHRNLEVRNGTIRDFGDRGIVDRGKEQEPGRKRLIDLRVISNGGCGICIGGYGNVVKNCSCCDNGVSGMCPGGESIVTGNICFRNARNGIHSGRGCVIEGNVVSSNGYSGISSSRGCDIKNNTVYGNNSENKPEHGGINVLNGCFVSNNTLRDNICNNVYIRGVGNTIKGNVITTNGVTRNAVFFVSGDNHCSDNHLFGNEVNYAGVVPVD